MSDPSKKVWRTPLSHNLTHPVFIPVDQLICIFTSCQCPTFNGVSKMVYVACVVAGTVLLIDDQRPVTVLGAHIPIECRAADAGIWMPIVGQPPAKICVVLWKTRVEHGGKLIPAHLPFGAPGVALRWIPLPSVRHRRSLGAAGRPNEPRNGPPYLSTGSLTTVAEYDRNVTSPGPVISPVLNHSATD